MISNISEIPQFFYDERIYDYVEELVKFGVQNFAGLHESECDQLTIRIIEVLGTDAYNIIIGSDNFDKTLHNFTNFLKDSTKESAYDVLHQLRTNALDHYSYDIGRLIEEIKSSHKISRLLSNNFKPYTDQQTGELCWEASA